MKYRTVNRRFGKSGRKLAGRISANTVATTVISPTLRVRARTVGVIWFHNVDHRKRRETSAVHVHRYQGDQAMDRGDQQDGARWELTPLRGKSSIYFVSLRASHLG